MAKVAEIKTKVNSGDVNAFLDSIGNKNKQQDSKIIVQMMQKATKEKPAMWGNAMVGFGKVRFKSQTSGREVDWFKIGFSPRKTNLSLYLLDLRPHADSLAKLGKYKTGSGCLYINKLEDVNIEILEKIIQETVNREASVNGATAL